MSPMPWEDDARVVNVNGRRFLISRHAAQRAEDMGVPLVLFEPIIRNGEWKDAPATSKHRGSRIVRNGKVALAVRPSTGLSVITTCLWSTLDAWREYAGTDGRSYRGDEWTERALRAWLSDTGEAA